MKAYQNHQWSWDINGLSLHNYTVVRVHGGPEPLRHGFDAAASDRDLRETYLPAFRATVIEGKAASVMCAYNRVNGQPCCENTRLLADILRGEWGFGGYVVSDCGAVGDIFANHRVAPSQEAASAADDGVRVYLDGKLVAEDWTEHAPRTVTGQVMLEAGRAYDVKVEYFESHVGAVAKLVWMPPSSREVSLAEAVDAAKRSDAIVMMLGISSKLEGEEMNVTEPGFKGGDHIGRRRTLPSDWQGDCDPQQGESLIGNT